MYKEILSDNQQKLLPLIKEFKREYYLVGGTAIALFLGHRRSIDFDLFKKTSIRRRLILDKITKHKQKFVVTRNVSEQLNLIIQEVNFTFFEYPFEINHKNSFENIITMPDLDTLAAMKAYALGRRAKWKDYVDLFFILKEHCTIQDVCRKATFIYGQLFSEKLFRSQLSYFDDIDYSEKVEYLIPFDESLVKPFLTNLAIDF
jgi:hypothetical protein